MKCSSALTRSAFVVIALFVSGRTLPDSLTPAQVTQFAESADRDVIVILRDQKPDLPATRGLREARRAAIGASQAPIVSELSQAGARNIRAFGLINAVAATISKAEADHLVAHPLVQAVVPDAVIRAPRRSDRLSSAALTGGAGAVAARPAAGAASAPCNTLEPEALQLTNTAFTDPATPQAQQVLDGSGQRVTGKGVKIAFLADGLDTTITGFTRPDGTPVFIDYQDFSGDPAHTATDASEAFGDASSIAAQDQPNGTPLLFDISRFVNAAHPLPSPCNIRIRGVAPDASLVGLKVFSALGYTTTSTFVQAIEWAMSVDDVDVINESIINSVFPDNENDPFSLANAAAIRGGVTVVVSSGDSGTAGTFLSPATEPDVIAVGATTQFRVYAQIDYAGMPLSNGGYIDNNISALSSGGFAQTGTRTVDVVAPGDFGWALCSSDTKDYTGCANFVGGALSAIQVFGGTSESAPLTAGEAALVIQAYRSTHQGANPTPALIKQIIMSTATDLGAPSYEQGAGLINSLKAVQVALSVQDSHGSPSLVGNGLLITPDATGVIDMPNTQEVRTFTITNTGSTTQHLVPTLQTLGTPMAGAKTTVQLDPATDPTYVNVAGALRPYVEQTFMVPQGAQHLDAAVAFQTPFSTPSVNGDVFLDLLDPAGRQAAYSLPQGDVNGYGHVEVVNPAAGTWTAVIWTHPVGDPTSYAGVVHFAWSAERYTNIGSVSPASFDLVSGASRSITTAFAMPALPGDVGAAIRFLPSVATGSVPQAEIPITLRTLVPIGPSGGTFTGTLTGGNGRSLVSPAQTYLFDLPQGVDNMSLGLSIADNTYVLQGMLVDPQGMELSVQLNLDPSLNTTYALQLFRNNPQPGRWRFILVQNYFSSGNQTEFPFTAQINFNTARVTAAGLPNSASIQLHAGVPVTIPVVVTNTGAVAEQFFADARLRTPATIALAGKPFPFNCTKSTSLPGGCSQVVVPPEVNQIQFIAQSKVPIQMVAAPATGLLIQGCCISVIPDFSPNLFAQPVGPDAVMASLTVPEVPYGPWMIIPSEIGPFGPTGARQAAVTTGAVAQMQPFDPAVSADSGNVWADSVFGTSTFKPLVLAPGQSGTIHLTITPPNNPGAAVSGYLYIDTYNSIVSVVPTGDEVVRIPYSYTIVR